MWNKKKTTPLSFSGVDGLPAHTYINVKQINGTSLENCDDFLQIYKMTK